MLPNHSPSSSLDSYVWRSILKVVTPLKHGFRIRIRNGASTSFWIDKWVGERSLIEDVDTKLHPLISHEMHVGDFIRDGRWVLDPIEHVIPIDCQVQIRSISLPTVSFGRDVLIWVPTRQKYILLVWVVIRFLPRICKWPTTLTPRCGCGSSVARKVWGSSFG